MGVRIELVLLFVLGASWACDARDLTGFSDVLQIFHQGSNGGIQAPEEVVKKVDVCTLCEEFAGEALVYLSQNKTQTEIMQILHKSCSKLSSFKQQCITLMDYYAPLFFFEISEIQPADFCGKVNLCEEMVSFSQRLSTDSCELCHLAVSEALLKLKDTDTELEIIEVLLKACGAVEKYVKKCKLLVFEYGPLILANVEQLLEANDVCTMLHACKSPAATSEEQLLLPTGGETSLLSKY